MYEWDAAGRFVQLGDPHAARFEENWAVLRAILTKRPRASTAQELLTDWPADQPRPAPSTLYDWLDRAYERKLVKRFGSGRNQDPWKFRLENADDPYLDRCQVPPLDQFDFLNAFGRSGGRFNVG